MEQTHKLPLEYKKGVLRVARHLGRLGFPTRGGTSNGSGAEQGWEHELAQLPEGASVQRSELVQEQVLRAPMPPQRSR